MKFNFDERTEIPEEDIELFEKMKGKYVSDNERRFFEIMQHKEEYELAPQNDDILHHKNNEEHLNILRVYNTEYDVFRIYYDEQGEKHRTKSSYSMCLAEALSANLKEYGVLDYDCTLLEWLRKNDYKGVDYNGNYSDDYAQEYDEWK